MARFELKRNGWLIGISALMISTAVWADDVTTVPEVADDSGLVVVDDGGPQVWHDINPGAGDDGSDLAATDDGSGDGTDTTVVGDGSGDGGELIVIDAGGVQFWHDLNPGAGDDGSDVTATDDGSHDGTDTTVVDDGSGDGASVDDGTDTTVVDDGLGDGASVDDGTDTTVVDDGSGDGTSVDDGTDVTVVDGGTVVDGTIPEVIYTMVSGACMGCDAVTSDVVTLPRSVDPATVSGTQVVAHEPAQPSGGRCDGAAIAWLCEWKTGKSN